MYQLIEKANTDLTNDEAQELVSEFENLVYHRFDDRKEILATKVDLANNEKNLRVELANTRTDILEKVGDTAVALDGKMNRTYRSLMLWIVAMGILNVLPDIIEAILKFNV